MNKAILPICLAIAANTAHGQESSFAKPDFAFPATVESDAEAILTSATAASDGLLRLRALLQIYRAKLSIGGDSVFSLPAYIGNHAEAEKADDARGLMFLLQARAYNYIYNAGRNKYDRIDAPLSPLPENPAKWSGKQFQATIDSLVERASAILSPYGSLPLTYYSSVVTTDSLSQPFYPYLRDFTLSTAAQLSSDPAKWTTRALELAIEGTPEWVAWWTQTRSGAPLDTLIEQYNRTPHGLGAAYLLLTIAANSDTPAVQKQTAAMIDSYLACNDVNEFTDKLQQARATVCRPSAEVKFPSVVYPGQEIKFDVKTNFVKELTIKITNSETDEEIQKINLKPDSTAYQQISSCFASIKTPGTYDLELVMPLDNTGSKFDTDTKKLIVTPVMYTALNVEDKCVLLFTDTKTGKPLEGIEAMLNNGISVKSDSEGITSFDITKSASEITIDFDDDNSITGDLWLGYYKPATIKETEILNANVLISRPLFKPGETLEYSIVVVSQLPDKKSKSIAANRIVKAQLFDSNMEELACDTLTTDDYGRANGSFGIPAGRLSGQFSVFISDVTSGQDGTIGIGRAMVSQFKRPVFEILDTSVALSDSSFIISGRLERYTGTPLPDADIEIRVDDNTLRCKSDTAGLFSASINAELLTKNAIFHSVAITATAPSGDIATEMTSFISRLEPELIGSIPKSVLIDSISTIPLEAYDCMDLPIDCAVEWTLTGKKKSYNGVAIADKNGVHVDWTNIPAGKYGIKFRIAGQEKYYESEISLFSVRHNNTGGLGFIVPKEIFTNYDGNELSLSIGLDKPSVIYIFSTDNDQRPVVTRKHLGANFSTIKIPLSSASNQSFYLVKAGNAQIESTLIHVERPKPKKVLWLKGESWRDKIIPGSGEHWTLKLDTPDGTPCSGAGVATLYNRALESLAFSNWPSSLSALMGDITSGIYNNISFLHNDIRNLYTSGRSRSSWSTSLDTPEFMYDIKQMVAHMLIRDMAVYKNSGAVGLVSANRLYEASATTEEVAEDVSATTGDTPASAQPSQNVLRNPEVYQAFWRPKVDFDDDGTAVIDFTMPDAVGAWSFRAMAWDKDCRYGSMSAQLTSSKPVTAESNLPRFVRNGDRIQLPATVINHTDSAFMVKVAIELFDVASGATTSRVDSSFMMEAKAQKVVCIDAEVPAEAVMIGYRIKAAGADFTDGEQALIPVLESSTVAVDSDIFYLTDSKPRIEYTIAPSSDGLTALQYCQNPVWDVVKALPQLYTGEPSTSFTAASAGFAACVARGLSRDFPEINRTIALWKSEPSDSALVSRLTKNEDLKLSVLQQTPFAWSATAQTDRMQRLDLTFSEEQTSTVISAAADALEKLQRADGGFAWADWAPESSIFVTEYVLRTLGRANILGYLTDERLQAIAEKALCYVDANIDVRWATMYALLRSLFPLHQPSTDNAAGLISTAISEIKQNWRTAPVSTKALYAIILARQGEQAEARRIIASIEQFAVPSSINGLEIPSIKAVSVYAQVLEATAIVAPDSKLIDGLRQWLTLHTQTSDDLSTYNPTELIAAYLSCGPRWTSLDSNAPVVSIAGRPIDISKVEAATGTFSLRIPQSDSGRSLVIERNTSLPVAAYGSVVTVSHQPLDSINPSDCQELSISKRLLVERDGRWVETSTFNSGEIVKVQLCVDAKRDFDYITVSDSRPAAFEPLAQMPGFTRSGSLYAYRENTQWATNLFLYRLPKGVWYLEYEASAMFNGEFISGTATIQSQYAPEFTARSGAWKIIVE